MKLNLISLLALSCAVVACSKSKDDSFVPRPFEMHDKLTITVPASHPPTADEQAVIDSWTTTSLEDVTDATDILLSDETTDLSTKPKIIQDLVNLVNNSLGPCTLVKPDLTTTQNGEIGKPGSTYDSSATHLIVDKPGQTCAVAATQSLAIHGVVNAVDQTAPSMDVIMNLTLTDYAKINDPTLIPQFIASESSLVYNETLYVHQTNVGGQDVANKYSKITLTGSLKISDTETIVVKGSGEKVGIGPDMDKYDDAEEVLILNVNRSGILVELTIHSSVSGSTKSNKYYLNGDEITTDVANKIVPGIARIQK